MASFSQMPTLGEFVEHARRYGFRKHTVRVPGLGTIKYLRRESRPPREPDLVDLPPMPESRRLARAGLESLCQASGVPREDFGL